ncbi:MAG: hypothetical protein KGM92_20615, partial [Acidobacteriota bacterium]|nr:hypothetical protein [Acidobacteriota bacterium]
VMAKLPNLHCLRCGHDWIPKSRRRPFACPRCHSIRWDEPWSMNGERGAPGQLAPKVRSAGE